MLLKMWKIIIIIVSILITCNAQEDSDCDLDGVTPNDWLTSYTNAPVDDFEKELFARLRAKNILGVEVIGSDYGKYFSVVLEDDFLVISPTEAFKDYEIEQESVVNPEMYIQLSFQCANSKPKNLAFYQPVKDSNTYAPEFKQPSYTYKLPMPLYAGFDIGVFGDAVEACDNDISNTRLDFSIIPDEDFSVTWGGPISGSKNKCHKAVIKTRSYIRLKASKSYKIIATDIGNLTKRTETDFIVEIDEEISLPPNPQFDFAYYTAKYITEDDLHTITVDDKVIKLEDGCSKVDLKLDLPDHFDIECIADEVKVKVKKNLPDDVLKNEPIVIITIEATLENAEEPGRTVLVVYLPKQECPEVTTTTPEICPSTVTPTECPACPTELTTSFTCPPCNTECPSTPTECPLSSTTPGECPSTPTECPLTCPPCSSTPGDCPSVSTECPVTCPTTPGIPTECPLTCPTYSTTPGECPSIPTECPLTCPSWPTTPTECLLTCPPCSSTPGDCPSVSTECPVTCPTTPGIPTECPLTCPTYSTTPGECPTTECPTSCPTTEGITEFPLSSTTPGECPSTECPISCPTPELTTECPLCPTTTEPPLTETKIKFEKDNYNYRIRFWNVGTIIGIIKATVDPKEDIDYSILSDTMFLQCDKKTGILTITSVEVEVGTYSFTGYAVGAETKAEAKTIVVVEVKEYDENEEPNTEFSVLVKRVLEDQDKETEIVLPCSYTYCEYTLGPQYPETPDDDIFRLDNNILYVSKVQREREDIIGMLVPQFSIHFFLNEVGTPLPPKQTRGSNGSELQAKALPSEWTYIPQNIANSPNQLFMSIIIEDINNNYPIFEIGKELVVGYPTAELAIQLTPPYLAKVVATDLDAGDNAIIRYSTNSEHFTIHPETGVIYPAVDAFDDEDNLKFTITAKDRKGADAGLSTDLKIEVKPLTKENLIVLMVKNLMLEDIDDTMKKLSEETGMQINYLTAAVIPLDNNKDSSFEQPNKLIHQLRSMFMPKANSDHSSKVIVYGLDSDNKPVETNDLQEVLEGAEVLGDFTVDKWEPGSGGDNNNEEPSLGGYIAAISVLAVLLVIFMIAAGVFYYFKIYKVKKSEPYGAMEEEDTHSVNFEKNPRTSTVSKYEDPMPQRRVTGFVFNPPPIEEDEDEFGEKTYHEPIDYAVNVKDEWTKPDAEEIVENKPRYVNAPEDDLYGEVYNGGSTEVNKEDSPTDYDGERRKSVKFKETVEKINIVVDDRQDEDILDERL